MKIQILFFIALFCRHDFKAGKPQQQLFGARILKLHGGFGVLSAAFDSLMTVATEQRDALCRRALHLV